MLLGEVTITMKPQLLLFLKYGDMFIEGLCILLFIL